MPPLSIECGRVRARIAQTQRGTSRCREWRHDGRLRLATPSGRRSIAARGRRGRSISRLTFAYDVLEWRNLRDFDPSTGEHHRMELPQWVPIRIDLLLHPKLLREIQDLVEDQARETELRRKSHS